MFHLYAYENMTLDGIIERFEAEGVEYRPAKPRWSKTSVHAMLTDRQYIGEVRYRDNWYPGKQEVIIDRQPGTEFRHCLATISRPRTR